MPPFDFAEILDRFMRGAAGGQNSAGIPENKTKYAVHWRTTDYKKIGVTNILTSVQDIDFGKLTALIIKSKGFEIVIEDIVRI